MDDWVKKEKEKWKTAVGYSDDYKQSRIDMLEEMAVFHIPEFDKKELEELIDEMDKIDNKILSNREKRQIRREKEKALKQLNVGCVNSGAIKKVIDNYGACVCGEFLVKRTNSINGTKFLGCTNYPKCKQTKQIEHGK